VLPNGKAKARRGRPPDHFRKAIVAASAQHSILRSQSAARDFKRSARVIVKPAHEARRDLIWNFPLDQLSLHPLEVLLALGVKVINNSGEFIDHRLVGF